MNQTVLLHIDLLLRRALVRSVILITLFEVYNCGQLSFPSTRTPSQVVLIQSFFKFVPPRRG
jgi:hypothetical protein